MEKIVIPNNEIQRVEKKWGEEVIIHNGDGYCGKLLRFDSGCKFSMHFHVLKRETFYINEGIFILKYIDTTNADEHEVVVKKGDVVEIYKLLPHQLITETGGEIYEVSTEHFESDSYRVTKGDSQMSKRKK